MHPEHIESATRGVLENRMDILKSIGMIKDGRVDSVCFENGVLTIKETILPVVVAEHIKINFSLDNR